MRGKFANLMMQGKWRLSLERQTLWAAAIMATLAGIVPGEAAPPQLLNKTILFSFINTETLREAGGRTFGIQVTISYTAYGSSAGRIFERTSRSARRRRGSSENEPNSSRNKIGEAHKTYFEGNKLVNLTAFAAGASRITVSFDAAFSSCTVACGVFAHSDSSWAITTRDDARRAKAAALVDCAKHGNACRVVASVCADGAERFTAGN